MNKKKPSYEDLERQIAELRDAENKYRLLFDNEPNALTLADVETLRFIDVNRAACRMFGYSREEFLTLSIKDITAEPEDSMRIMSSTPPGMVINRPLRLCRKKDGSIFPVELSLITFMLNEKLTTYGVFRDITERMKAEEKLIESENNYKTLIENVNIGIFMSNLEGEFIHANSTVVEMAGYDSIDEIMKIPAQRLYADIKDREQIKNILLKNGHVKNAELRSVKKDGTLYWISMSSVLLKDNAGNIIGILGSVQDITERKRVEEALSESEEKYRAIVDNALIGLGISDGDKIIYFNKTLLDIYGYDDFDEVAAKPLLEHLTPESREIINDYRRKRARGEALPNFIEHDIVRKDGTIRTLQLMPRFINIGGKQYAQTTFIDITERKKAEEEIRNYREHLEILVEERTAALNKTTEELLFKNTLLKAQSESSIDGILVVDEQGKSIYYNNHFREIWDMPEAILEINNNDAMFRHITDKLINPSAFVDNVRCLNENKNEKYRGEIEFKNGKVLDSYSAPVIGADSKHYGRVWYFRDITERKRTEEALRKSKEKYQGIFDESVAAIYLFDDKKNFIDSNQAGLDLLGYTRDELMKMSIPDVDADPVEVLPAHEQLLSGQRLVNYEHRLIRKDGKIITVLNNSRPITDENGKAVGMLSTLSDISERKQAEIMLQNIMDNNPMSIQIVDKDGFTLKVNASHTKLFGSVPPPDWSIFNDAQLSRQGFGGMLERVKNGEVVHIPDAYYNAHDYSPEVPDVPIWLRGIIFPLDDNTESDRKYVLMHENITARKKAEDALRKSEEQLLQSQKMEAIGQLAGGIAHDFNNIIATISGTAEMLVKTTPPDAPIIKKLERILNSSQRAKDLTMKLLAFARKEKLNVKNMCPTQIVNDVIDILKSTLSAKINIISEYEAGVKGINVDSTQIFQAILNMSLNACDAMPKGGILTLKINSAVIDGMTAADRGVRPGDFVEISISDTGTGIDEDIVGKIFEPFFTTKDRGKGSGLGMSVSHGIISAHEGFIDVKTQKGKGTTFSIYLPASDQVEISTDEKEDGVRQTVRGSILIIDDDQDFIQMMTDSLEIEGFQISVALSGVEAVDYYKDRFHEIDVILLDMILPEMHGPEIFRALKELNPGAKIILCSGYSIEGEATALLESGASAYMQKPFGISEIVDVISGLINNKVKNN